MDCYIIKTERLLIRRVLADDWKALQAIWANAARSEYAQYDHPSDLDDQSVMHRVAVWASFSNSAEHLFWAVCLNNVVIGYIVFHKREDDYETGYCFHSNYHGKGYAKESMTTLLDRMKTNGVTRITAGTALNNTPSVNLLHSLGFRQKGTEKVSFFKDENGRDIVFDGGIFELEL